MSEFIGSVEVNDGYNGDKAVVYLVKFNDVIYAVHRYGYHAHPYKLTTKV